MAKAGLLRLQLVAVLMLLGWAMFFAPKALGEGVKYLPVPPEADPLGGLLPAGGIDAPSQGLLKINSQYLKRKHEVRFDTREVEIVQYVQVGEGPQADSTAIWQAYYSELFAYTVDMGNLAFRYLWMQKLTGQEESPEGGTPGTFVFDLPFKVPDWMKNIGVDRPRLTITGSYKLVAGGTKRSGPGLPFQSGSWLPNFQLDQQPAFAVKGTVGRLISVEINSEDGFGTNLKDQLKLSYRGEGNELEDDVVQEIEAGNTSLSLTGTSLTGYTENHKGIFGLKVRLKFGDLEMTTIASQEGGSQEKQKLGVGSEERTITIEDRNMDLHHHFFMKLQDREDYKNPENWKSNPPKYIQEGKNRRTIDVYQLLRGNAEIQFQDSATACAYNINNLKTDVCERGRWKLLKDGDDFVYDEELRMLSVKGISQEGTIAVRYQGDPIFLPGSAFRDSKNLILLHAANRLNDENLDPLMWRNVYNIGIVATADRDNLRLDVLDKDDRRVESGKTKTYATLLGLTRADDVTRLAVDNRLIFKLDQGLMVLPCLSNGFEDGDPGNCLTPMKRAASTTQIYDEQPEVLQNGPTSIRFATVSKQRRSTFDVRENSQSVSGQQCYDITPDTEKLTLNGSTVLKKGQDYEVLYESGQITLTSPRARDPQGTLDISYECTPAFQIQDKVLLGTRLEYKLDGISDQSMIGATVLFKSQTTTEKRPEVGREPFNQVLWGFNTRLAGEPKWMTNFANAFPLVHTEAVSRATFDFEVAQSRFNPNSRGSAFLENFEFSQNTITMPMTLYSWFKSSPPNLNNAGQFDELLDYRHQGKFWWHSSFKEEYGRIYGNSGNAYTNSREQTVLTMNLQPNDNLQGRSWGGVMRNLPQGLSNLSRKRLLEVVVQGRDGKLNIDLGRLSEDVSIGGMNSGKPNGTIQSELAEGESTNKNDAGLDGKTDESGETGVRWECKPDCVALEIEPGNSDPSGDDYTEPKPEDNATEEPASVNGTEGNNKGTRGFGFDTEDLDRSGNLDTLNRYIRYSMPLDSACSARFYCEELKNGWRRYQIPLYGGGTRIDPGNTEDENRILSNAKFVRMWLNDLPPRVARAKVLLARLNVVGNTWEENTRNTDFEVASEQWASGDLGDSTFLRIPPAILDSNRLLVDVINRQEESRYFQSPNTPRERNTSTDEPLPEYSLVMNYQNLHRGEIVHATRILGSDAKDLSRYDRIRMEIHPDSSHAANARNRKIGQGKVSFGLRFGKDRGDRESDNYYEVRIPMDTTAIIDADQRMLWERNSINIRLGDLTRLKNDPRYLAYPGRAVSQNAFNESRKDSSLILSVVGDPNLGRVDWMRLVVYVDSGATERQSGEIWVNDLRLEGVDRSLGTALRSSIQLDFADFINVSGNMQYTNGGFATLSQSTATPANAKTVVDYNSNFAIYANKFMPDAWGVSLPFTWQWSGALERPFTRPFSDVALGGTNLFDITGDLIGGNLNSRGTGDSAADVENAYARVFQTLQTEKRFSTSYKKDRRTESFWVRSFLERPEFEYRQGETDRSGFFDETGTDDYKFKWKYDLSPNRNPVFKPFGWSKDWKWMPTAVSGFDFTPLPDKIKFSLADYSFVRNDRLSRPRNTLDPTPPWQKEYKVDLTHGVDAEWRPISALNFSYRLDITRNFDDLGTRSCFTAEAFFDEDSPCGQGFMARHLIFDFDGRNRDANVVDRDTIHRGEDYGILAKERNRNQSFSGNFSPSLLTWLTTSAAFNSGYHHNLDRGQNFGGQGEGQQESRFNASSDHDIRLSTGFNPGGFLGSMGSLPGLTALAKTFDAIRKKMDEWRIRNLDLSYTISHKYNSEAFSYRTLSGTGVDWRELTQYQLGWLYTFSELETLRWDKGEPQNDRFDWLTPPDNRLGVSSFNHGVTRALDLSTGFSVPIINLDISGNLKMTRQFTLYRESFLNNDTTITWPEYTLSASLGDFAQKLPWVRTKLRSLTAYSNYNYRESETKHLYLNSNEENRQTHTLNPILRLSGTTNGDVRIENSVNGSRTDALVYPKIPGEQKGRPLSYWGDNQELKDVFVRNGPKATPSLEYSVGDELTVSYDVETQKGIQIWRWYMKLKNNLRLSLNGSANYYMKRAGVTRDEIKREREEIATAIKPGASYNFTNNVDASFYTQYKYSHFFHKNPDEYLHDFEMHSEFTMRF